jgi:hypothetical protein
MFLGNGTVDVYIKLIADCDEVIFQPNFVLPRI